MRSLTVKRALISCFIILFSSHIWTAETVAEIISSAREAIRREAYPQALKLLTAGENDFPDDFRIPLLLGDLYSMEELYNLALESFLRAEELEAGNLDIMSRTASAYGRLNRNMEAVELMEKTLLLYPDSLEIIADLGWMYFKTYRPSEGAELLLKALIDHGETPGLLMTLGTLYTGMYDYEGGREYYLRSIEAADAAGWSYFSSVAYYNLALLDLSFYKYEKSMKDVQLSLELAERSSGYICLGELALTKMDFHAAMDAFTRAYNNDETPLSMISLAELYLKFGMLQAAESHLDEAWSRSDASWMYYFGVDPERHLMDLHELYGDLYLAMSKNELKRPLTGFSRLPAFFNSLKYRIKSWYHRKIFEKTSLKVGRAYLSEGNQFDSDLLFYYSSRDYRKIALKYLERCEAFEFGVAPESRPHYRYEEGMTLQDPGILYEALDGLDPVWERSVIDDTLSELIPLISGGEQMEALNLLFGINPGAFIREGFTFPVLVVGGDWAVRKLLKRGGLDIRKESEEGILYSLRIDEADDGVSYSFREIDSDRILWSDRAVPDEDGEVFSEDLAIQILTRIFFPG